METTHGILNQSRETRPETWRPWDKEEYGPAGGPSAAARLGVMMAKSATPSKTREFAVAVGLNPPTASEVGTKIYKENLGRLLAHGLIVHGSTRCPRCAREGEVLYVYTDHELELTDEPVYACEHCESGAAWVVRQVASLTLEDLAEVCVFLTNYAEDLAEYAGAEEVAMEEYLRVRALRNRLFALGVQTASFDPLGTGAPDREDLLSGEPCSECGWFPNNENGDHHPDCPTLRPFVPCQPKYDTGPLRIHDLAAKKRGRWAKLKDLVKLAVRECRAVRLFLLLVLVVTMVASFSACTPQQANQWLHDYYVSTGDPRACTEDMACWDCETMGNRDCGPAQNHRGSMGTMSVRAGERHRCHTDLECESQYRVAITGEAL